MAVGMFHVHDGIVVVELVRLVVKGLVVYQAQAIDRLDERIVFPFVQLPDDSLRCVQQYAALELLVPVELHLNDELSPLLVLAAHIHDTVFLGRVLGHHLGRQVFHAFYLSVCR